MTRNAASRCWSAPWPCRPGVASWYANLSALYRMVYRMQDALRVGQEAIRLDPQNADHLVNLSLVFTDVDDREHAIACLLRALGLKPDHADGHLALGQNLLAMGDFEPGWMEYEWRNLTEAGKGTLPKMTSAAWNGMRIPTRAAAHGRRSGLRRHDPVRPLHPDGRGTLSGGDPGLQRGDGAVAVQPCLA